eukprot:1319143-Rhodomonas_salina.1
MASTRRRADMRAVRQGVWALDVQQLMPLTIVVCFSIQRQVYDFFKQHVRHDKGRKRIRIVLDHLPPDT